MPAPQSSEQVRKASQGFWTPAGGAAAILVAIHLAPKGIGDQNVRLAMTVAYFACLFTILWALGKPRDDYMQAVYGWKYREGGPALEQHYRLYLSALSRLANAATTALGVFVLSIAISVFSHWTQLGAVTEIASWAWWLSLFAIVLFPVWGRQRISNVLQRKQLLREAIDTSDIVPKELPKMGQASQTQLILNRPAVEAVTEGRFRAGGMEWDWEDFYKNAIIFGSSGTGKTVCVLNSLLDGLLASREHAT